MSLRARLVALIFCCFGAAFAPGQVVVTGYTETGNLPANDDDYSGAIDLGFAIDFGGSTFTQTYVSNNGYITFGGGSYDYYPYPIDANYVSNGSPGLPIIAAFFADVDTRDPNSGIVSWGTGLVDGNAAFVVNWDHVGEFGATVFSPNTFGLILVSRTDLGTGNFDVYFNYEEITWDHGGRVVVGFHDGNATTPGYYSAPGSFQINDGQDVYAQGAFLDSGTNALANATNTGAAGLLTFVARDGGFETVAEITPIPEPSTYALLVLGLAVIGFSVRRRRKS
ncbi:MAG: PEP-CTERM sorting domain-containing protein [Opitutaceae bacterium]